MHATIIFPHQLFERHPAIIKNVPVWLVEEDLFFTQYKFHKQKLVFHRASMKAYESFLLENNIKVDYIDSGTQLSDCRKLIDHLAKAGVTAIHCADVADDWLRKRLRKYCSKNAIAFNQYPTPCFLNQTHDTGDFFEDKKFYFQTDFYIDQRKKRKILLEQNGQPLGGKWSYDSENRRRLPKKEIVPPVSMPVENNFVPEARKYIAEKFGNNYGNIDSGLAGFYPVTFREATEWLDDFLINRFAQFGVYQDAMVAKQHFLFHSVLTPMLNTGLLTPQQVIDKAMDAAINYAIPLNSLEGFIRQILGWREFIRIVYEREGGRQRTTNYWGFTRKIPPAFRTGETGIVPVDMVIKKLLKTGYSHHIERLMIMGNFMLLCEFDPDDVYHWFMEMYIDSYNWVMVPNVYGMTQFADGGLMATKPYISASNYLIKMGDFEKGAWQEIWDGLFWRFMHVHRRFFLQNPRLGILVNLFDKMPAEKKAQHLGSAERYLDSLNK